MKLCTGPVAVKSLPTMQTDDHLTALTRSYGAEITAVVSSCPTCAEITFGCAPRDLSLPQQR